MKTKISIIYIFLIYLFFMSCAKESSSDASGASDTGVSGSLARFTIVGDYLYTVDENTLKLFSVTDPATPKYLASKYVGFGVETIFPYKNNLFMGTNSGMYIYSISTPESPKQLSFFTHVVSCDPVVVQNDIAYVTLHSDPTRRCFRSFNQLQIIDVSDLANPVLKKTYNMTKPLGLGIDKNILFVCDKGLSVYNVSNPMSIQLVNQFDIEAEDVIPLGDKLLVIGANGFIQYSYDGFNIKKLSEIKVEKIN